MGKVFKFRGAQEVLGAEDDAWMFEGLEALAVVIEDLDPVAVEAGLDRTNIQFHVERRLGELGIPVAPIVGLEDGEGIAVLYVAIGTARHAEGSVAFFLTLQVCEAAALARDPSRGGGVTTWLSNGVWSSAARDLARDAVAAIDEGLEHLTTSGFVGMHAR